MNTFERVRVTPERAAIYLKDMIKNRSVKKSQVKKFTNDMTSGKWAPLDALPTFLYFLHDGTLVDGQHRLLALIASGTIQEFYKIIIDEKFVHLIDIGSSRTLTDVLEILKGNPDARVRNLVLEILKDSTGASANALSVITRKCMAADAGRLSSLSGSAAISSREDELKFIEQHPELIEYTRQARDFDNHSTIYAAAWWDYARTDKNKADKFFVAIRDNVFASRNHPANTLVRQLAKLREPGVMQRATTILGYIYAAIQADYRGEKTSKLKQTTDLKVIPSDGAAAAAGR